MTVNDSTSRMLGFIKSFERVVVTALICFMTVVILLATVDVGRLVVLEVMREPVGLLQIDGLLDIFGMFLLVLVGIELLYTLRAYWVEDEVHVEVVFAMALIAVARKVIILDVKQLDSLVLVGIAALVLALSAGYYLVARHVHAVCSEKRAGSRQG